MAAVRVTVIIVSYNVCSLLRACLASIQAGGSHSEQVIDLETWVFDNASTDGSVQMVRSEFPDVYLVASTQNIGFAGGNNSVLRTIGFGGAPGSVNTLPGYVLLLNPDAELRPEALGRLVAFMEKTSTSAIAGPQLQYPDGRFQHSAFKFPGLAQILLDFFPLHGRLLDSRINGRYPRRKYVANLPFQVDFVLGAAMLVRGAAIQQVGLLDESYFMYCEEMDWCWRMHSTGWEIYCVPEAVVVHHEGQSTRQNRKAMQERLWQSRQMFFRRYYSLPFQWLARPLIGFGRLVTGA